VRNESVAGRRRAKLPHPASSSATRGPSVNLFQRTSFIRSSIHSANRNLADNRQKLLSFIGKVIDAEQIRNKSELRGLES
jgi:hypothetical protein